MKTLENRVALITGAGRGIGRAIALSYATEGARLSLAARTESELAQTAQDAQARGASTCTTTADVSDPEQVDALVRYTRDQFGAVDILVNALGPGSIHTQMWDELRDKAEAAGSTRIYEIGQQVTSGGGASLQQAADLAVFLASDQSGTLSGRLISAVGDDFANLSPRIADIMASDALLLRRVGLP